MSLVSVIVPVYKAGKYLPQCVDSLLNQTLSDIEIILVDDGSPDNSSVLCDEFSKKDQRVLVIHQPNQGAGAARKNGLSVATGEYVCFIDADDYVEKDFCEKLYLAITKQKADIAECGYYVFSESKSVVHSIWNENLICHRNEFFNKIVFETIVNGTEAILLWNKIYHKEFIEKFVSDWGENLLEDYVFMLQYYSAVEKYVYIDAPLIHYRQLTGSLSRRINKNILAILKKVENMKQMFILKSPFENAEIVNEEANKWYCSYIYNYIKNHIAASGLKKYDSDFVMQLLYDDLLYEKCLQIKNPNQFHQLIARKNYKSAFALIQRQSIKEIIRRKLHKWKSKVVKFLH